MPLPKAFNSFPPFPINAQFKCYYLILQLGNTQTIKVKIKKGKCKLYAKMTNNTSWGGGNILLLTK